MIVDNNNMDAFSSFENMNDGEEDFKEENEKKRFKSHLYKPPTSNELNELRETENLFHSNLFRMQINELLSEISLKDTEFEKYKKLSIELIDQLKSVKGLKEKKIKNLELFKKHNIVLPLSDIIERVDGNYTFTAPKKVELIGSFTKKSAIKPVICIDIGVQMPAEYFNERDFLNYRYFIKRILYMATVCIKLLKSYEDDYEFNFVSEYAAVYKPYLCLKPKDSSEAYEIRLHFTADNETFKLHRFNPTRNNVRKQFFFNTASEQNSDAAAESDESIPTMHYNFEILSDIRALELNGKLNETLTMSQGIIDGLKLLKLWLYQRQLNQGFGSFNNFIMSMYVAYLVSIKRINHLMSSYQIFRIVLLNLSQSNWDSEGISMNTNNMSDEHCLKLSEFHKHYDVVFVDSSGYLNICSNMNKNTFKGVKHEAALAIECLNNQFIDSFDALFMKKVKFIERFDSIVTLTSTGSDNLFKKIVEKKNLSDKLIENYNNSMAIVIPVIESYIEKALDNRIRGCFTQIVPNLKWSIHSNVPSQPTSISIGLLFDKSYTNILIKGPISNLPEAREFRNFWGEKSELRRFQDSTICEAVYYEANDTATKRTIYSRILKHIFNLHLGISETHLQTLDKQLDSVISLPKEVIDNYGTGEERLTTVVNVFDDLVKIIKSLRDMPLSFSNIQGISSTLRLTNVFSPLPSCFKYDKRSEHNLRFKLGQKYLPVYPLGKCIAPYVEPIKVSCVLETSNKWPDDLECIKRFKCAFSIKLAQLLREVHGLLAFTNIEFCDVFYKGYVFRLLIQTTRELAIMKSSVENGVILSRDNEESMKIEMNIFHLPKLTSVLHALQQEHNHYSGVARLVKRWLSCHLLLDCFNEESIDLICAYLFVHPEPFEAPKSLIVGFIRFIEFFANFDFKTQPLIINFNNEFKKDDLVDIQLNFQTNRSNLPLVYIATSYDANKKHSVWTKSKPDLPTLCRTILLAKECLKKIESFNLSAENGENFRNLFKASTQMYDVVIHLKAEYCPKAYQRLDLAAGTFLSHYREYDEATGEKTFPIVDFDPVKSYVKQLRDTYSDFALFFYDSYGATDVYVLWKPKSFETKELKVANMNGRTLDSSGKKLIPNIEAIIEDFQIIGHELVKDVTIRTEKLVNFE